MKTFIKIIFVLSIISNQHYGQMLDSHNQNSTSRTAIVFYETGMGILTTAGGVIFSSLIINALHTSNNLDESLSTAGIIVLGSLTFAGSYGVHFVDKRYNKNSSYLTSLGGSLVGLGVGYILLINAHQPIGGYEAVLSVIAPLTFSILAVNILNFERFGNEVNISYTPTMMFNKVSHNINLQFRF